MTMPLTEQQAHANQVKYEYHLTLIESAKYWLNRNLLTLACIKAHRPKTAKNQAEFDSVWRDMQKRYAFVKDSMSPRQQAKYQRLMTELTVWVAVYVCKQERFPKGYEGLKDETDTPAVWGQTVKVTDVFPVKPNRYSSL